MTIRMIRIINYALKPPRGMFEILQVLPKGVVHELEEKLSIFGTTESDHKFSMKTAIPYFMTIRMIQIINYALTPPRGMFEILQVLPKGVVHELEEKLSIYETESDHKFGHGDCHTIFYDHKNDSDQ